MEDSLAIQARARRLRLQRLLGVLIFIGFVIFVQVYFGWLEVLAPWRGLSWGQLGLAIALVLTSYWVRAIRVYDYFRAPMGGAFMVCLKITLQHNLLNNLLPFRAGELSFPVLLARHFAIPALRSLTALLWFRALDLHVLGLLALLVAWWYRADGALMLLVVLAWCALPLIAYRASRRGHALLQGQHHHGLWTFIGKVLASLPQDSLTFWRTWLWSLLNWVVKLGVFTWVLLLFIDMPVAGAWIAVIAGDLTSVLPIHSVAGMGTYEAGVVAGALPFGLSAGAVLPAALNLHLFILSATFISGLLSVLIRNGKNRG